MEKQYNIINLDKLQLRVLAQMIAEEIVFTQKEVLNVDEACKFLSIKKTQCITY